MRSRLADERRKELAQEALAMTPGERVAAALALGERAVLDYMENFGVDRAEAMRVLRRAGRAGRRYSKVMDEPADERADHGGR